MTYTNMPTKELVALVFNATKVDDMSMELATRLIMAEEELEYLLTDEGDEDYPEAA